MKNIKSVLALVSASFVIAQGCGSPHREFGTTPDSGSAAAGGSALGPDGSASGSGGGIWERGDLRCSATGGPQKCQATRPALAGQAPGPCERPRFGARGGAPAAGCHAEAPR